MSETRYDVIVIGVGGMGSAAAFELARRGLSVLGLEQFDLVHDRGSSHGLTRVIRKAYYEHPSYVPLVRRAYECWYDLEQRTGKRLLTECCCLNVGAVESELVRGVQASAEQHSLAVETLSAAEVRRRYPPFQFSDEYVGVLERDAGFLYVEECVRAHIDAARKLGAKIHANEAVVGWRSNGSTVRVETNRAHYSAERLVLTAGPWAGQLLRQWGNSLSVMRQVMLWFGTFSGPQFRRDKFPIYLADIDGQYFYGLPEIDLFGHKVARHYGAPELSEPSAVDRVVTTDDETAIRTFLRAHLPAAGGPLLRSQVCTYTLTPDRHFILDRHPEFSNVAVAAGFSGHGFKFAPAVGEIMADLVTKGNTDHAIEMFRIGRFAV